MPGKVKVKIISGKNLPIMDRSNDTTDAYVEIKLGNITYKTEVCRRTLHPRWNTDWYRFELDDSELQDEPLQIRLMDHDTYSANDAIGKVYLNLNPLLLPAAGQLALGDNNPHHEISGWIPVYDTMHGIRGEVNVTVKVEIFSDFNKFRQSSCGIKFFYSQCIPHGYQVKLINGFVEELIVDDDPEYQWIDKIRTPRASNEARQTLFFKLSGELQRKIGVKALNLGGNAVIGYKQCFDLEGESGIVARGIGTAVTLIKAALLPNSVIDNREEDAEKYLKFVGDGKRFSLGPSIHSHAKLKFPLPWNSSFSEKIPKKLTQRLYSSLDIENDSSTTLKILLDQEDKRRNTPIYKKLSKFKGSQKSLLKSMSVLKTKLNDRIGEGAQSSSASKRSNFKRTHSDSGVMAKFLARSVLQATSSLGYILENRKKPTNVEDTVEPTTNNDDGDGSDSSSETSSSASDEKEFEKNDVETVSNIVSNIEALQKKSLLNKQYSLPTIPIGGAVSTESVLQEEIDEVDRRVNSVQNIQKKKVIMMETSFDCNVSNLTLNITDTSSGDIGRYSAQDNPLLTKTSLPSIPTRTSTVNENLVLYNLEERLNLPRHCRSLQERADKSDFPTGQTKKSNLSLDSYSYTQLLDYKERRNLFSCFSERNLHQTDEIPFHHPKMCHSKPEKDTQTYTEFLYVSLSSPFNNVSQTNTDCPGSSGPKSGLIYVPHTTNKACITPNRQNASPTHQDGPGSSHHKKDGSPERITGKHSSYSPVKLNSSNVLHRRSSDSDLSITPKGNSLTGSDRSGGHAAATHMKNHYVRKNNQENFEMMEYPFLTMNSFPSNFIIHIGSSVSSKSVKVLERISNIEEPESRDSWWSEIRTEIRAHARSLNCNAVLGYTESASIYEDVCVLNANGTAAVVDFSTMGLTFEEESSTARNVDRDGAKKIIYESPEHNLNLNVSCRISHLPYDDQNVPANAKVLKCPMCSKGRVPEVLIVTVEPPENLPSIGKGCFIECHVSRPVRDCRGESIAREISDGLPFLEYELHRLLVNKLKIKGMNAIFSLKIRYSMGDRILMAVASGTAIYMTSLHPPTLPVLVSDRVSDEKIVAGLQEMLIETIKKNREIYEIKDYAQSKLNDDELEDGHASLDLAYGNKDCSILEMDDPEDAEVVNLLMEDKVPDGFHVVNTESVPGLDDLEIVKNLQMFIQIYRAKITNSHNLQKHFHRLLQSVYFKLRRMVPCALCDLQFRVDIPDSDEIQLCIIGMALGLGKKNKKLVVVPPKKSEDDLIFKLDEDTPQDTPIHGIRSNSTSLKYRPGRSPLKHMNHSVKQRHVPYKERHGVDITPLFYVPKGNIKQYLGNLNFFFIRETTSIREEGGLSGFIHSFITEVLAIVRSHVSALGGNALIAFFMTECMLHHNLHKNQGQCLINVGGDVVLVSYQDDE